jgi:GNAT superfamily N-acetyltransferase
MLDIRLSTNADEAFLKSCIEAAYHEYPRLIARGGATLERAVENVIEMISSDGFAHIATLDGRSVGAAWWLPDTNLDELQVAYFVADEARGQGIASHLLETGMGEARQRGAHTLAIKTHPNNAASIALATKLGFEPIVALFRHQL